MGPSDSAWFRACMVHQGPKHEESDFPRILMFVQGVDLSKTKSRQYTANMQQYVTPSVAQVAEDPEEEPMFR